MLSAAIFTLAYRSATQVEPTEAVVISASTAAISTMAAAFIYFVGGTGVDEWAPELDDMDLPKYARTRPVSAGWPTVAVGMSPSVQLCSCALVQASANPRTLLGRSARRRTPHEGEEWADVRRLLARRV